MRSVFRLRRASPPYPMKSGRLRAQSTARAAYASLRLFSRQVGSARTLRGRPKLARESFPASGDFDRTLPRTMTGRGARRDRGRETLKVPRRTHKQTASASRGGWRPLRARRVAPRLPSLRSAHFAPRKGQARHFRPAGTGWLVGRRLITPTTFDILIGVMRLWHKHDLGEPMQRVADTGAGTSDDGEDRSERRRGGGTGRRRPH